MLRWAPHDMLEFLLQDQPVLDLPRWTACGKHGLTKQFVFGDSDVLGNVN
jgi:hypothetical protein